MYVNDNSLFYLFTFKFTRIQYTDDVIILKIEAIQPFEVFNELTSNGILYANNTLLVARIHPDT